MTDIKAILFDKDGTLFDFKATWGAWTNGLLAELAQGNDIIAQAMAQAIGYDRQTHNFAPDSPVIAGTPQEIATVLLPFVPGHSAASLLRLMNEAASNAPMAEATPLVPLLDDLARRGLTLGVATNDAEAPARAHLWATGIEERFDFIAGFDSGFGAKPDPGMLLAFADAVGVRPADVLMVGDSRHDLAAGRAAGMRTMGVLTGLAQEVALAPLADIVVAHIGQLPAWLEALQQARQADLVES